MDLKKYRQKLIGSEQERAVSPVIGVILMVAITVILAAVIAAFVLDMGDEMGNTAPTTSVDTNVNSDWDASSGNDVFYLAHTSGDSIAAEEVRVVVREADGTEVATLDGDGDTGGGLELSLGSDFDGGTTITVANDGTGSGEFRDNYGSNTEINVQLIHRASDTTVTDTTHELP